MNVGLFGERQLLGNVACVDNDVLRCFKFTIFSTDATVFSLGWFHVGRSILAIAKLEVRDVGFCRGRKAWEPGENLGARRKPATDSTHVTCGTGLESNPDDRRRHPYSPFSIIEIQNPQVFWVFTCMYWQLGIWNWCSQSVKFRYLALEVSN